MDRREYLLGIGGLISTSGHIGTRRTFRSSNSQLEVNDALDGHGIESDPYLIRTVADLRECNNALMKHYELRADIDLSSHATTNDGSGFEPLKDFMGTFDGNGHAIRGLTIDRPEQDSVGLFAELTGTVRSLELRDVSVIGGTNTGSLAGKVKEAVIEDVRVTGDIQGYDDVGGVVGRAEEATLSKVRVTGTVEGGNVVGGLIGSVNSYVSEIEKEEDEEIEGQPWTAKFGHNGACTVKRCTMDGTVDARANGGGIAGAVHGETETTAKIVECKSSGTIRGNSNIGGIIGSGSDLSGGPKAVILQACRSNVTVKSSGGVAGGIAGALGNSEARHCQADGVIEASNADRVGGIVGSLYEPNGRVTACLATGLVSGNDRVGGIAGRASKGTVRRSRSDGPVKGRNWLGGIVGQLDSGAITDVLATCDVSFNEADCVAYCGRAVGGLVGRLGGITGGKPELLRGLATGAINSPSRCGGAVGEKDVSGTVSACYWDRSTTGCQRGVALNKTGGGRVLPSENGASTDALQGANATVTLSEFDFQEVWQTHSHAYPTLRGIGRQSNDGTCRIVSETVDFDYPVTVGDRPEFGVVADADAVTVTASYEDASGSTVSVERELQASEKRDKAIKWTTREPLPAIDRVGTFVELSITAESEGESCTLETLQNPYVDESDRLGYYVFEETLSIAIVYGRFPDEDPEANPDRIQTRHRAQELDVNRLYGSGRGSMGEIGFSLERIQDGEDFYVVEKPREEYDGDYDGYKMPLNPFNDRSVKAQQSFLDDLESAADFDPGEFDAWAGVHRGNAVGPSSPEGRYFRNGSIYMAELLSDDANDTTWPHEFAHRYGLRDVYDIGLMNTLDIMGDGFRATDFIPKDIPNPAPFSTPLRLGETLSLFTPGLLEHYDERSDWLEADVSTIREADQQTIRTDALQTYELGDSVPVIRGNEATFVVESRPFLGSIPPGEPFAGLNWNRENGSAVVYRRETGLFSESLTVATTSDENAFRGVLSDPGEYVLANPGLYSPAMLKFTLDDRGPQAAPPDEFWTATTVELTSAGESTRSVATSTNITRPNKKGAGSYGPSIEPPSVHLTAEDSKGRRVGPTEDGWVVNIPGARGSGPRQSAPEWLTVPKDADVSFTLDASDIDRYLNDLEESVENAPDTDRLREEITLQYRSAETLTGSDPSVTTRDGDPWIKDASIAITEGQASPGVTVDPVPGSDAITITAIDHGAPVSAESITIANRGEASQSLGGWTLSGAGASFEFPPETSMAPDETLVLASGSPEDVTIDADLYWKRSAPVWPDDGGTVTLTDSDDQQRFSMTYDGRGALYYGTDPASLGLNDREDDSQSMLVNPGSVFDDPITLTAMGLVGISALYAAVRMRSGD